MNEQRLTHRMVKMWDKLAALTPPPMFAQFNQGRLSDVWQQCAVLQIEPGSQNDNLTVLFEYVGDKAKALVPSKDEGKRMSKNSLDRNMKKYLAKLEDSVSQKMTIVNNGTLVNDRSKVVKYRTCLLPFTDSDGNVTHIIVGFSWIEC